MAQPSRVISHISARACERMQDEFRDFNVAEFRNLNQIGIGLDSKAVNLMMKNPALAMDQLQPLVTQASVGTPVQFLQNWLPGFVFTITAARKIDEFIGIQIIGAWEDEMIVQGILERTGKAVPYGDYTNVPLSSWNNNYVTRTVIRFEEGMKVGNLEAARSARMQVDDSGMKRESCALQLEIERNQIGFYGFNGGANNTYGFLNDPGLLAYTVVATGAAGHTQWQYKTFLEIQKDILTAIQQLRTQSQDTIDPTKMQLTLAVATDVVDFLATTTDFGISVLDWLHKAYPGIRVTSAPQLNDADTVDDVAYNVFYLYADKIQDMSTDGGTVWIQAVPAKFQVMGVQQLAKAYEEDYSNATAGAMCKRPWAVTRWYGI